MYRYGIVAFAVVLVLPDPMEQFLGADNLPFPLAEDFQDRKFRRRQHQRLFVQLALMGLSLIHI